MYSILCISNRRLCTDNFISRIKYIADCNIPIILREKDLSEDEYLKLLQDIGRHDIIAHSFADAARKFGTKAIHMPLPLAERTDLSGFETIGISTHSIVQARHAKELGASYITAGHIFATDCKKNIAPHGTELIRSITASIDIPVYGLGGINEQNAHTIIENGGYGIAVMSGFMTCSRIDEYIEKLYSCIEIKKE